MGIYGGCEDTGVILGSALGGVVWSALGPTPTFLLVGSSSTAFGAFMTFTFLKKPSAATVHQRATTQRSVQEGCSALMGPALTLR